MLPREDNLPDMDAGKLHEVMEDVDGNNHDVRNSMAGMKQSEAKQISEQPGDPIIIPDPLERHPSIHSANMC